jgi:hypothetical protein
MVDKGFRMFQIIKDKIQNELQEETVVERSVRMLPGALFGEFAATVYILTLYTINIVTIPGQHFGLDWGYFLVYWIGFSLGLALSGAIVGWFTEDYAGVVGGGVIMTLLLLLGNLLMSVFSGGSASLLFQSVVTAIPLVGGAVLIAGGLRYVIKRHVQNTQNKDPRQRKKLLANLIGIVLLVSWVPGVFSRYESSAVDVFKALNKALQNGATDPLLAARFSLEQLPGLQDHFGTEYKVYPRVSIYFAGSMDITVRFKDGYSFSCVVPTDAGEQTFFTTCNEGNKMTSP